MVDNEARLNLAVQLPRDRFVLEVDVASDDHVLGIFGPSGSGKTSLLEVVAGLERGATGRVGIGGKLWLDSARGVFMRPEARRVGYVPQDALLFPHLDVKENLLAGARRARRLSRPVEEMLRSVSATLGLEPLWSRDVSNLSGGERQRVALGRALCSAPELLLLDEPLSALDMPLRRRLLGFIRRVREDFDIPMLVVSHDPTEVQALCDSVVVLREGRVVARGAPHDVLADPQVFELAAGGGFENTLPCRVTSVEGEVARVRLGQSVAIATRGAAVAAGDQSLVGIPSRDIIVATSRPEGLSARNVIAASIDGISASGTQRVLRARVAPDVPQLIVELSAEAASELGLEPGREVFLVFKSASCVLYPAG
jgi:molybdate transport system ATP-binding protein